MQNILFAKYSAHQKLIFAFLILFIILFSKTQAQNFQEFSLKDVTFPNGNITLNGNLFMPENSVNEKVPAVVVLHGSGPDEGLEYRVYAEEFSKRGIAALVFDKRGSGKSGGDCRKRPFEFLAADALSPVEFLREQKGVDAEKVGIWGISQSGWVVAKAAAKSRNIAFVISVAGNGISPLQQNLWHIDQKYKAKGFSEKTRDTGLKFWKMTFDWLILVDEGYFPLPENILESERAGVSIGLNYDALPDWENINKPVLLIHGEKDLLSPRNEAIAKISESLRKSGNNDLTVKVFPASSHTITTNKIGLEFDWDEHFAVGYFDFTAGWIKAKTFAKKFDETSDDPNNFKTSADFQDGGKYVSANMFGRAIPQLILWILFPLLYLVWAFRFFKKLRQANGLSNFIPFVFSFFNLILVCLFFYFIYISIFPTGMHLEPYSIPTWQRFLPVLGNFSAVLWLILLIKNIFDYKNISKSLIFFLVIGFVFLIWLYY